ncbi:Elicitor-responsive protein 3 [Capsicum baccatum]|uniref:Elicitor-responsive protein 3 n=1 Tax=Capsicum baccatum TaxID=33114 RepID=A0A2G2XKP1_CAPBA|nr:Elicitor-responsive protein 3 [Capsicum baccatum]
MVRGKLEVLLVSAKGLENTDFLNNMDPYVVLTCRTQEQKSSVASGKGSDPEWNETFIFSISEGVEELFLKIMDSDSIGEDDFVGEAKNILRGNMKKKALVDGKSLLIDVKHHSIDQLVMIFQVSQCGFHMVKTEGGNVLSKCGSSM